MSASEFLSHIFALAFFPFTSQTFLVVVPAVIVLCYSLLGLLFRLIRGDFHVLSV